MGDVNAKSQRGWNLLVSDHHPRYWWDCLWVGGRVGGSTTISIIFVYCPRNYTRLPVTIASRMESPPQVPSSTINTTAHCNHRIITTPSVYSLYHYHHFHTITIARTTAVITDTVHRLSYYIVNGRGSAAEAKGQGVSAGRERSLVGQGHWPRGLHTQ